MNGKEKQKNKMKHILCYKSFINESQRYISEITQEEVPKIIEEIKTKLLPYLNIGEENISFIGSAGKLKAGEISYNINLAICEKTLIENNIDKETGLELEPGKTLAYIKEVADNLGYQCVLSNKKLLLDWPIAQRKLKGVVEVRIQTTPNLEWLNFIRYSPNLNEDSEFPGKYREALLQSIVESIQKKVISYFDNKGTVKEYKKYIFDIEEGLFSVIKSFDGQQGKLQKATINEESKKLITNDPSEFTKIIFGENVNPEDIMTFENIINIFKSENFPHKKKMNQIIERFTAHCSRRNLAIPQNIY